MMTTDKMTAEKMLEQGAIFLAEGEVTEGLRLCRLAAEQGYMYAQSTLGHYCEMVLKDIEQAAHWYGKAAEQGHEAAAANFERLRPLAGLAERLRTAMDKDSPSEETLDADAMLEAGNNLYLENRVADAFKWLRRAAEAGNLTAQFLTAALLVSTDGTKARMEAIQWFEKIALQGFVWGVEALVQTICPAALEDMENEPTEPVTETDDALHRAAHEGDVEAQYQLSQHYFDANDMVEAVKWARRAAIQGQQSAQANLGFYYEFEGNNRREAIFWNAKAAMSGYGHCIRRLAHLGLKELEAMAEPPIDVSEMESTEELFTLGMLPADGMLAEDLAKNGLDAQKFFIEATNRFFILGMRGSDKALFQLGSCFFHGDGVQKDHSEAVYWWKRAADKGHADAMRNLAASYAHGLGIEKDDALAKEWKRKAEQSG